MRTALTVVLGITLAACGSAEDVGTHDDELRFDGQELVLGGQVLRGRWEALEAFTPIDALTFVANDRVVVETSDDEGRAQTQVVALRQVGGVTRFDAVIRDRVWRGKLTTEINGDLRLVALTDTGGTCLGTSDCGPNEACTAGACVPTNTGTKPSASTREEASFRKSSNQCPVGTRNVRGLVRHVRIPEVGEPRWVAGSSTGWPTTVAVKTGGTMAKPLFGAAITPRFDGSFLLPCVADGPYVTALTFTDGDPELTDTSLRAEQVRRVPMWPALDVTGKNRHAKTIDLPTDVRMKVTGTVAGDSVSLESFGKGFFQYFGAEGPTLEQNFVRDGWDTPPIALPTQKVFVTSTRYDGFTDRDISSISARSGSSTLTVVPGRVNPFEVALTTGLNHRFRFESTAADRQWFLNEARRIPTAKTWRITSHQLGLTAVPTKASFVAGGEGTPLLALFKRNALVPSKDLLVSSPFTSAPNMGHDVSHDVVLDDGVNRQTFYWQQPQEDLNRLRPWLGGISNLRINGRPVTSAGLANLGRTWALTWDAPVDLPSGWRVAYSAFFLSQNDFTDGTSSPLRRFQFDGMTEPSEYGVFLHATLFDPQGGQIASVNYQFANLWAGPCNDGLRILDTEATCPAN